MGKCFCASQLENKCCYKKDVFIRVYDYYTEEVEEKFKQDFWKGKELFTYPFILTGLS